MAKKKGKAKKPAESKQFTANDLAKIGGKIGAMFGIKGRRSALGELAKHVVSTLFGKGATHRAAKKSRPAKPAGAADASIDEFTGGLQKFLHGSQRYHDFTSSNVTSSQYDPENDTLYLQYKGGDWYGYEDTSPREAAGFYSAGSKGKWAWDHLRVRGSRTLHRKAYFQADPPGVLPPKAGRQRKFEGGIIQQRFGTPGYDNEPIYTEPGEFVVPKEATKKNLSWLQAIKDGMDLSKVFKEMAGAGGASTGSVTPAGPHLSPHFRHFAQGGLVDFMRGRHFAEGGMTFGARHPDVAAESEGPQGFTEGGPDEPRKMIQWVLDRYGPKTAAAIIASGQAVGWGASALMPLLGLPPWIPGSTILGMAPGIAAAELYRRFKGGSSIDPNANREHLFEQLLGEKGRHSYARGGPIGRKLGSGSDDEPIFATPGEYIIPEDVTKKYRSFLDRITAESSHRGGGRGHFQAGGPVTPGVAPLPTTAPMGPGGGTIPMPSSGGGSSVIPAAIAGFLAERIFGGIVGSLVASAVGAQATKGEAGGANDWSKITTQFKEAVQKFDDTVQGKSGGLPSSLFAKLAPTTNPLTKPALTAEGGEAAGAAGGAGGAGGSNPYILAALGAITIAGAIKDKFSSLLDSTMNLDLAVRGLTVSYERQVAAFNPGTIERYQLAITNLSAALGSIFEPIIESGRLLADEFNKLVTNVSPEFRAFVADLAGPAFRAFGSTMEGFMNVLLYLKDALAPVVTELGPLVEEIGVLFKNLLTESGVVLRELVTMFADELRQMIRALRVVVQFLNSLHAEGRTVRTGAGATTVAAYQARQIGIEEIGQQARASAASMGVSIQQQQLQVATQQLTTLETIGQLLGRLLAAQYTMGASELYRLLARAL